MLQGFDKETAPLNAYERNVLLPQLLRGLSRKHGKANKITANKIIEGMEQHGYKLGQPRLRKLINHIRTQGLIPCLVSSGNGYYIATSSDEVDKCISSLQGRIASQQAVIAALKQQQKKYFI